MKKVRSLKKFDSEEYFKKIRKGLSHDGYTVFDTNMFLDIGTKELTDLVINPIASLEQTFDNALQSHCKYLLEISRLLEEYPNIIVNEDIMKELNLNLTRARNAASFFGFGPNKQRRGLFCDALFSYIGSYKPLMDTLASRTTRLCSILGCKANHYHGFRELTRSILSEGIQATRPSLEDRSIMFFMVNAAVKEPMVLFSNDKDIRKLALALRDNTDLLNAELKKRGFHINYEKFYDAHSKLNGGGIIRSYRVFAGTTPAKSFAS